ncbi:MAG: phage tail protein [Planctomycetes bacterium]|nr:phage tail protein [Planctomycetota bacterium]
MADVGHSFSGDLQLSATGDLLAVNGVLESQQRILRRLLTNPQDYIWEPAYGAGLPAKIGMPLDEAELDGLIRSQMFLEPSVVQNPAPQIVTGLIPNGIDTQIQYVEADSSQPATLSFDVTP